MFNLKGLSKKEKFMFFTTLLLKILVIVLLTLSIYFKSWFITFVSILFFIFSSLPSIIKKNLKIHLPVFFDFILVLFLFGTLILGEITGFYNRFWWWDIFLHAFSAFVLGLIGFLIIYSLRYTHKIQVSPSLLTLFSFSFALALGAIWEIIEFIIDLTFKTNMQKSGLLDTMGDLIVDFFGALLVSIIGFVYLKTSEKKLFKTFKSSFKLKIKKKKQS